MIDMAFLTDTFSVQGTMGDKLVAFWSNFREARTKRAVYRQTINELAGLSNRELADLGIHRSAIRRIAYESAYTK